MFLAGLREEHLINNVLRTLCVLMCERDALRLVNVTFLVDSAFWLQAALDRHSLRFQYGRHGNRNSIERIIREIKQRTNYFSNCFSPADPETVEH